MMLSGLGDSTTATTTASVPTFGNGLSLWTTPSTAFSAMTTLITNPSTAFSSSLLPFTAGVMLVPVAAVLILMNMGGKKK